MEEENKRLTIAIISGAAHALKYKAKNPRAADEEVISHITNKANEILEKIDEGI